MNPLFSPLDTIKPKIQPQIISKYHNLHIYTLYDLLLYTPRKYLNFTQIIPISELGKMRDKQPICLTVRVIKKKLSRIPRRKLNLAEITVQDTSGSLKIALFNQKFLYESLKEGELYALTAIAKPRTKGLISSPNFERILPGKTLLHSHRLVPIYPETQGVTSKMIRYHIALALKLLPKEGDLDPLPKDIRSMFSLPDAMETVQTMHYPQSTQSFPSVKRRLAFHKILLVQLYLLKQKMVFQSQYAPHIPYPQNLDSLITSLPFPLTGAQKRSIREILTDLDSVNPMNRLLEGDVGTGKTIVALLVMSAVTAAKKQAALMAPTEILATQHFESFVSLWYTSLPKNFRPTIALLTAHESRVSVKPELGLWTTIKKSALLKKIKAGEVDIIIGTHSLISEKVTYADLALTIVDEQHRFGVKQRADLQKAVKRTQDSTPNTICHLLSMTATPIPRTLALSIYGDLDLSLLDEYPAGRKPIKTRVVTNQQRTEAYAFIKKHLTLGRQAFVVCPKIETTDDSEVKSVEEVFNTLQAEVFPEFKVRIIHGKLSTEEKDNRMQDFSTHKYDILVSTSVIEVGVNIPNANIMLVEGAERFGLAQLHQFRGRVGRGEQQSFCFLFETGADSQVLNQRLIALEQASNGFELAELDLELRGPGQFIGSSQSGLADIGMEALRDHQLIADARKAASLILQKDLSLSIYPDLKYQLQHFQETVHFE